MAGKIDILIVSLVLHTLGTTVVCRGIGSGATLKPEPDVTCKSWEFSCLDGSKCIPEIQECDGMIDCDDGSDEANHCTFFTCGDGRTVSTMFICDGYFDCADESDESETEANCTRFECANGNKISLNRLCDEVDDCNDKFRSDECDCDTSFTCSNKKCISSYLRCDDIDDCGDNSDESLCDVFTCKNGGVVDISLTCNGIDNCDDTSDECDCENSFNCTNGRCINIDLKGNGIDDCGDDSDEPVETTASYENGNDVTTMTTTPKVTDINEETLTTAKLSIETTNTDVTVDETSSQTDVFTCDSGVIIDLELVCDGTDDCMDGFRSDECNCSTSFVCDNMKCIDNHLACDGVDDCGDCSDELGCVIPGSESRTYDMFFCYKGSCIRDTKLCDDVIDCIHGDDENDCDKDDDVTNKATTSTAFTKMPASQSTESGDGVTVVEDILTEGTKTGVIEGNIDVTENTGHSSEEDIDVTYDEVDVTDDNENNKETDDGSNTANGDTEENETVKGSDDVDVTNAPEIPSRFSSVKPKADTTTTSKSDSQGGDENDAISKTSHIAFSSIAISLAVARMIIP